MFVSHKGHQPQGEAYKTISQPTLRGHSLGGASATRANTQLHRRRPPAGCLQCAPASCRPEPLVEQSKDRQTGMCHSRGRWPAEQDESTYTPCSCDRNWSRCHNCCVSAAGGAAVRQGSVGVGHVELAAMHAYCCASKLNWVRTSHSEHFAVPCSTCPQSSATHPSQGLISF